MAQEVTLTADYILQLVLLTPDSTVTHIKYNNKLNCVDCVDSKIVLCKSKCFFIFYFTLIYYFSFLFLSLLLTSTAFVPLTSHTTHLLLVNGVTMKIEKEKEKQKCRSLY